MKKYLIIIISIVLFIGIISSIYLFGIKLILNDKESIDVLVNSKYQDSLYKLTIFNKKINNLVKTKSNLDLTKLGKYQITYSFLTKKVTRNINVIDNEKPIITLNGSDNIVLIIGNTYTEEGYSVSDNYDKDLTEKVIVTNNIDYEKTGEYFITYTVKDSSNNENTVIRTIVIENKKSVYESVSNQSLGWGITQYTDGTRPEYKDVNYYKEYNTYFLGKNEKVLYLTFDEGGNPVTYVNEIVDILNKYNIKGTFFFCYNYLINNPDLIKKIDNSGHMIGNHTINHYSMPTLIDNPNNFMYQINKVEEAYQQVTGKKMTKLFRYPNGEFSLRTLTYLKDLGYRQVFWSVFYNDWQKDTSKEYAYNILTSRRHNGAIYLIHPKNKGNYEALEDFIIDSISNGYTFDLVTNI